jgi:RNA polymerase sigma-70 factor (ECF subfamily)
VAGGPSKTDAKSGETGTRHPLEDVFAQYQPELLGMLYHLTGDLQDAQDALQESFVKCWRNRDRVPELQSLKAWVFRVALNAGRDVRQTAWRRHRRPMADDAASIASSNRGPLDQAEHNEQVARLRAAVRGLRAEEQEVFLLRQNGEMTYEEIADALGVPAGTVKTRMRLAILRLRSALEETPAIFRQ